MNHNYEFQVLVVDSYRQGLSVGRHTAHEADDLLTKYYLRFDERMEPVGLRRRFTTHDSSSISSLTAYLNKLKRCGILDRTEVYIGVGADPFHPFDEKFHVSLRFLEQIAALRPGRLIVQTRSPLVVLGIPALEKIKDRLIVSMGIETLDEKVAATLTPELPHINERLSTLQTLRNVGFKTMLQMAPILPYGDWRTDAQPLAEKLSTLADFIFVQGVIQDLHGRERMVAKLPLARRMQVKRYFHWVRPDTAAPLLAALSRVPSAHIGLPKRSFLEESQLSIFSEDTGGYNVSARRNQG